MKKALIFPFVVTLAVSMFFLAGCACRESSMTGYEAEELYAGVKREDSNNISEGQDPAIILPPCRPPSHAFGDLRGFMSSRENFESHPILANVMFTALEGETIVIRLLEYCEQQVELFKSTIMNAPFLRFEQGPAIVLPPDYCPSHAVRAIIRLISVRSNFHRDCPAMNNIIDVVLIDDTSRGALFGISYNIEEGLVLVRLFVYNEEQIALFRARILDSPYLRFAQSEPDVLE